VDTLVSVEGSMAVTLPPFSGGAVTSVLHPIAPSSAHNPHTRAELPRAPAKEIRERSLRKSVDAQSQRRGSGRDGYGLGYRRVLPVAPIRAGTNVSIEEAEDPLARVATRWQILTRSQPGPTVETTPRAATTGAGAACSGVERVKLDSIVNPLVTCGEVNLDPIASGYVVTPGGVSPSVAVVTPGGVNLDAIGIPSSIGASTRTTTSYVGAATTRRGNGGPVKGTRGTPQQRLRVSPTVERGCKEGGRTTRTIISDVGAAMTRRGHFESVQANPSALQTVIGVNPKSGGVGATRAAVRNSREFMAFSSSQYYDRRPASQRTTRTQGAVKKYPGGLVQKQLEAQPGPKLPRAVAHPGLKLAAKVKSATEWTVVTSRVHSKSAKDARPTASSRGSCNPSCAGSATIRKGITTATTKKPSSSLRLRTFDTPSVRAFMLPVETREENLSNARAKGSQHSPPRQRELPQCPLESLPVAAT
jgi:hypothetical protein